MNSAKTLSTHCVRTRPVQCNTLRRTRSTALTVLSSNLPISCSVKDPRLYRYSLCRESSRISGWKTGEVGFKRHSVSTGVTASAAGITTFGVQWLIGVGVFVVCIAASIFFISALSTLSEVKLAARRVNVVMRLLELEMPETMAAMRLSSIEISDCIEEFTSLGSDLASGLRSSANAVAAAEKGVQEGTRLIQDSLLPAIQVQGPRAKKVLEGLLQERAMLDHDRVLNLNFTHRATSRMRSIRQGVSAIGMGIKAASFWKAFQTKPR